MKTTKLFIVLSLCVVLLGGCTKEAWQEMYLSDILGTWSGYSLIDSHYLTVTFDKDKKFSYRLDNDAEVVGSYKYVSVGGMITLIPVEGDEIKWYISDREEYSMNIIWQFRTFKISRSGQSH